MNNYNGCGKYMATHPTLFTEPRGFAAVSDTLAGYLPDVHNLGPVPAAYMAWATIEGELIFSLAQPEAGDRQ